MIVQLVTDASFCVETRVAAWAAWSISPRGRFFGGNVYPTSFSSINSVELHALITGLRVSIDRGVIRTGDHIDLQTDSEYVAKRLHKDFVTRKNRQRLRQGLIPDQSFIQDGSLRGSFLATIAKHELTFNLTRSSIGWQLQKVDCCARRYVRDERRRIIIEEKSPPVTAG